ncbi:hypothetical protein ISCGN_010384 [Ixodes scapularis]
MLCDTRSLCSKSATGHSVALSSNCQALSLAPPLALSERLAMRAQHFAPVPSRASWNNNTDCQSERIPGNHIQGTFNYADVRFESSWKRKYEFATVLHTGILMVSA